MDVEPGPTKMGFAVEDEFQTEITICRVIPGSADVRYTADSCNLEHVRVSDKFLLRTDLSAREKRGSTAMAILDPVNRLIGTCGQMGRANGLLGAGLKGAKPEVVCSVVIKVDGKNSVKPDVGRGIAPSQASALNRSLD